MRLELVYAPMIRFHTLQHPEPVVSRPRIFWLLPDIIDRILPAEAGPHLGGTLIADDDQPLRPSVFDSVHRRHHLTGEGIEAYTLLPFRIPEKHGGSNLFVTDASLTGPSVRMRVEPDPMTLRLPFVVYEIADLYEELQSVQWDQFDTGRMVHDGRFYKMIRPGRMRMEHEKTIG